MSVTSAVIVVIIVMAFACLIITVQERLVRLRSLVQPRDQSRGMVQSDIVTGQD